MPHRLVHGALGLYLRDAGSNLAPVCDLGRLTAVHKFAQEIFLSVPGLDVEVK